MTTDLRELLREARAYIVDVREGKDYHNQRIVDRIDAALAEKAPEPSRRVRAWLRGHMSSYGGVSPPEYDEECIPGEDQPEGEGWIALYAAPPPASPSDARDAARYRWLRDKRVPALEGMRLPLGHQLDKAIDAAIEREGGANG